jgi:hypothetical protein
MMNANVRSIDTLVDLKQSLARYAHEIVSPLEKLDQEAVRTLEWLAARRRRWQRQVESAQQALRNAQAALAQCEAAVYHNKASNSHLTDCSIHRIAITQCLTQLKQIETELQKTDVDMRSVEQVYQEFRRHRHRFQNYLTNEIVESQRLLERCVTILHAYANTNIPTSLPARDMVTAPVDALVGIFSLGLVASTTGLTGVALAAMRKIAEHLQTNLGDIGEFLVEKLLQEKLGWQLLPFEQPKHGFDRVFTAPGLPIIIVECKVNRKGELHLGKTQDGQQGSPTWIAARTRAMADPTSAQYSPYNAALAALIEEIGPEHVPTVAVVITTETGEVTIHYRRSVSTNWERLADGSDLTTLLQEAVNVYEASTITPTDQTTSIAHHTVGPHNYSPEFREGNFGGPERKG